MRTCQVEGCQGEHKARGYCMLHYHRVIVRGGDAFTTNRPDASQIRKLYSLAAKGVSLRKLSVACSMSTRTVQKYLRKNPSTLS